MNQRQAAALVGVAPFNCDLGMMRRKRAIWGARRSPLCPLYGHDHRHQEKPYRENHL
ncbi:hypothetical protein [Aquidulcibacter sp.]|uniref:hypothetical protein n=1 Tax=Aquidulcibacter sp. TaxID=2052990 RepID=UPI003917D684